MIRRYAFSVAPELLQALARHYANMGRNGGPEAGQMDAYDDTYEERSRGGGLAETILLLGALSLIALPAITSIKRRWRVRHPVAKAELAIDKSLKDSFPASDPPASRYFDIPANRK